MIDGAAQKNILNYIAKGKETAKLAFEGEVPHHGFYVPPTIFSDVDPDSAIAQEEIPSRIGGNQGE